MKWIPLLLAATTFTLMAVLATQCTKQQEPCPNTQQLIELEQRVAMLEVLLTGILPYNIACSYCHVPFKESKK